MRINQQAISGLDDRIRLGSMFRNKQINEEYIRRLRTPPMQTHSPEMNTRSKERSR